MDTPFVNPRGADTPVDAGRLQAVIHIESGSFVGRYLNEDYVLGPIRTGIRSAVQRMLDIKRDDAICVRRSGGIREPDIAEFLRIRERLYARL